MTKLNSNIDFIPSKQNLIDIFNYLNKRIDDVNVSGLSADGTEIGATTTTQVFTNGVILSNLAANSVIYSDASKKIVSGDILTGNAGKGLVVNATGDGVTLTTLSPGSTIIDNDILSARVATTAVLPGAPVYNNGAAGVGATLTRGSNGTVGTIDGVSGFQVGDFILVKNQATQLQNGLYSVTVVGSAGAAYVLTRTTSSDATAEFDEQVVGVSSGSTNGGTVWGQTTVNPTVGVSNIVYVAQTGTYVTQAPTGTQAVNQIAYYTAQPRRLTKGEAAFTYNPATDTMAVPNITVGDGTTGTITDTGGLASIVFDTASNGISISSTNGEVSMSNTNGVIQVAGSGAINASSAISLTLTVSAGAGDIDFNTVAGNADFAGIAGDILLSDWTFDKGVGLIPLIDATVTLGDGTFNLSAVHTNAVTSNTTLTLRTSSNGDLNLVVNGAGIVNMNGAATYTGTVAGAAGLNVVNGLIMA